MLTNLDFHLQTGNLGYKTGLSFTNGDSWVTNGILGLLFTYFKEQPTAYDVDKVVSEMEKDKFIDCETILSDIHQGFNAGLSRAIEIGKGGGVNG